MADTASQYNYLFPAFLEVKTSEDCGRGVYTKERLSVGTEVVNCDPFVSVVGPRMRGQICDNCFIKTEGLQKCGGCKFVRYCNRKCQGEDWALHKEECKGIARIRPTVPSDTIRLLVRLMAKKKMPALTENLPPGAEWELDILRSHAPRYSEELKESLAEQVFGAKLILGEENEFNAELVYKTACKLISNSFGITDSTLSSIGTGIYTSAPSLFNHSCKPNCTVIFDGVKLKIRTLRNIEPGEQLYITYIDILDTKERRRRQLQKCYLFTCSCERCSDSENDLDKLMTSCSTDVSEVTKKQIMKDGFQKLDEIETLKKSNDWQKVIDMSSEYIANNLSQLGEMNVVILKMRECLMDGYMETRDLHGALRVARPIKATYETYFPTTNNPQFANHLYKMACYYHQIAIDFDSLKELEEVLITAFKMLSVTHGNNHECAKEGGVMLKDIQYGLTVVQQDKKKKS